jgi:UDP-N-acetylmuramoyl-L-alanyl-D-glutamate--2,6-diaminopimelate ligase
VKPLAEFVELLAPLEVLHYQNVAIRGIACRPEALQRGYLYCVIDEFLEYGQWLSGAKLLTPQVLTQAAALLTERPYPEIAVPQLVVAAGRGRQAMARAAKRFFDAPDQALTLIGVTGTNGKTTTTQLLNQWLTACGERAAALGTLGLFIGRKLSEAAVYTTPLAPDLFRIVDDLCRASVNTLAMEVSSHALTLERVAGLAFDVAVFTNLSRDHLDFHGTMENYRAAKVSLFSGLSPNAVAVVNGDDAVSREIIANSQASVLDYGITAKASLRAIEIAYALHGTTLKIGYRGKKITIQTPLLGSFNVYNVLAALGGCLVLEQPLARLATAAEALHDIPGRMERVSLPNRRIGVVDYAHTPDSLWKALQTLRALNPERIITVFGCGGNRDKGKRPLMGTVAARHSDLCVVTSDNPRREDPMEIIDEILTGMPNRGVVVEPDRRTAIRQAYALSRAGDVILVAGKGHETYQIVGDQQLSFSDIEELRCFQ